LDTIRTIAKILLSWGPWGVLVLAALDSAGIPIPEGVDVLLVLVAIQDPAIGYLSAALAVAGSLAGSVFLFQIGRKGGEAYLNEKTRKGWGKKFRRWFDHYGGLTVFIPALIPAPLPLKIFVLCAGALGMSTRTFLLIMLGARLPRYFGEVYLTTQMGTRPLTFLREHLWGLLAFAIGLFLILLLLIKLKDRYREREA
jgi:membrane protein DedA with SNARE-associated domain